MSGVVCQITRPISFQEFKDGQNEAPAPGMVGQ